MPETTRATSTELVVLLDERGQAVGTAEKSSIHHETTPLHLGFSCYVFDRDNRILITRRSLSKRTWPGVWTNSFCGHPAPSETLPVAVQRRARQELGLTLGSMACALPNFRYRATAPDGTVENEICPVFCARGDGPIAPCPSEVMDYAWVTWPELRSAAGLRWPLSPWTVEQVPLLDASPFVIDSSPFVTD